MTSLRVEMDHLQHFNQTCVQQLQENSQETAFQQQKLATQMETQQRQAAESQEALEALLRDAFNTIAEVLCTRTHAHTYSPCNSVRMYRETDRCASCCCVMMCCLCVCR